MNPYRQAVAQYLASAEGRATPDLIAGRLLRLDPASVGMGVRPSRAQLHNTRVALEDLERMAREDN